METQRAHTATVYAPNANAKTVVSINKFRAWTAAIYPILSVVGKIASFTMTETYFSHKSNILNIYFVKQGWFWTTLVFWATYYLHSQQKTAQFRPARFTHSLARYVAATAWWLLFTQWLLGPSLMDRIFLWTGGHCVAVGALGEGEIPKVFAEVSNSKSCKRVGGTWTGGHDPSGHYFILVHSSMLLWMELAPSLYGALFKPGLQAQRTSIPFYTKPGLFLLAIWAWMFLMTSIYFHSFFEKLTGLLLGFVEAFVVYYLGSLYSWGALFGMDELNATALEVQPDRPEDTEDNLAPQIS